MTSLSGKAFGLRVMDTTGRQWVKLRADHGLEAESVGAWLAGYRAAITTFLSSVPVEERPVFEVRVDPSWTVTDVDEITDIIEYETAYSRVFNDF